MASFRLAIFTAVLFAFSATNIVGQDSPHTEESADVTSKMHYLLHLPKAYKNDTDKKWPLLIFLHGAGERGNNLDLVKKWGPPKQAEENKELPFIVVSPQCPVRTYWNIEQLNQLIDSVIKNNRVDTDRVYLTGLSMGGYGTWGLAALHPEKFAAIAPICGGGDPESAELLVDLPIWAFHGGADKVVPVEGTTKIVEAIKAKGGTKIKMTIYEGVGHNSWSQTYANPKLYEWFLQQKRK